MVKGICSQDIFCGIAKLSVQYFGRKCGVDSPTVMSDRVNYQPVITDLIFIRDNIYPGSVEGGLQFLNPIIFSGSLFTMHPYPTILAEVTIYPWGTAMQDFRFFTIIKFRSIYF
jgi:hypothetical protein